MTPTCPQSPTGAHWWLIPAHEADETDLLTPAREGGVCRYCHAQRLFTNAMRYGVNWGTAKAGRRGAAAKRAAKAEVERNT